MGRRSKVEPGLIIGLSIATILVFTLIMERLRLPMVLGILAAGALMSPASPLRGVTLGPLPLDALVVSDPEAVSFFALLGSVLILFGIGLEFSIHKLFQMGLPPLIAAMIKLGLTYAIGYGVIVLIGGFDPTTTLLLALLLTISSTPIVIKILEGHGKLNRPETPFIIAVLVIEDVVAVALLGLVATGSLGNQYAMAVALLKLIATFAIAYFLLSQVVKRMLSWVHHSDELLVLFVVSICLGVSYLCESIGLGFSVGSFLAGSIIAETAQHKRVEEMVKPFNTLFASFFFFSIGMLVDMPATLGSLPLLFAFLAVAAVGKFLASGLAGYLIGMPGRSAVFSAAVLLPLGELSLLIASNAAAAGLMPAALVGLIASIIVLTSLLSVVVVSREQSVYHLGREMTPEIVSKNLDAVRSTSIGVQRVVKENSRYNQIVSRLPSIGGSRMGEQSTHDRLKSALGNTLAFGLGAFVLYLLLNLLSGPWREAVGNGWVLAHLGFFIVATLFFTHVSTALRIYNRMLTHAGRLGFTLAIDTMATFFYLAAAVGAVLLSVSHAQPQFLILLLPVAALGWMHPLHLVQTTRKWAGRFARM